jgi:hypothetical protein
MSLHLQQTISSLGYFDLFYIVYKLIGIKGISIFEVPKEETSKCKALPIGWFGENQDLPTRCIRR